MNWLVILFWLLGTNLAWTGSLPHSSLVSVRFRKNYPFLLNQWVRRTNGAQNLHGTNTANVVTVNLPTPVNFQYDANGNLTNDGTRWFFYDAENQLTNVTVVNQYQVVFVFDGLNRRRIERDYTWQSSAWLKTNEIRFMDDGVVPIQERDTNNNPLVTYTRGLDLSASLSGAGRLYPTTYFRKIPSTG